MPAHGSCTQRDLDVRHRAARRQPAGSAGSVHTSPSASAGSARPAAAAGGTALRQPAARALGATARWQQRSGTAGSYGATAEGSVAAGVAPAAGAAVVGVLGPELAAAERAAREGAERVAGDGARRRRVRRVVEGELQLLELHRHRRVTVRAGPVRVADGRLRRPCQTRQPTTARANRASRTPSTRWRTATAPSAAARSRAALAQPTFRRVYIGACLSNIGMWAQNVVLGAFAYDLTGSAVVRRHPALRPARPAAALLARRRSAGRHLRSPPAADRRADHPRLPVLRPGGGGGDGRSVARAAGRAHLPHRHRAVDLRTDLQRAAPVARRPGQPGRARSA